MSPINPREYRDTPSKWLGTCVEGPYRAGARRFKLWEKVLVGAAVGLAVASLFYSKAAKASVGAEDTDRVQKIGLHLFSDHLPSKPYQRNWNPGLYIESASGWHAGFYENTIDRTSFTLGRSFYHTPSGLGLTVGAVSGYKRATYQIPCSEMNRRHKKHAPDNHICTETLGFSRHHWSLMAAPHYTLGPARLWFIPRVGDSSSVLHLSLEYSLK